MAAGLKTGSDRHWRSSENYIHVLGRLRTSTAISVGKERQGSLAKSMTGPWIRTNPKKVSGPEDLKGISNWQGSMWSRDFESISRRLIFLSLRYPVICV